MFINTYNSSWCNVKLSKSLDTLEYKKVYIKQFTLLVRLCTIMLMLDDNVVYKYILIKTLMK